MKNSGASVIFQLKVTYITGDTFSNRKKWLRNKSE